MGKPAAGGPRAWSPPSGNQRPPAPACAPLCSVGSNFKKRRTTLRSWGAVRPERGGGKNTLKDRTAETDEGVMAGGSVWLPRAEGGRREHKQRHLVPSMERRAREPCQMPPQL